MPRKLPKSTSDDSHLAGESKQSENKHFAGMAAEVTEGTSDDTHLADDGFTDTPLGLVSYNVGIQNSELQNSKNWAKKYRKLQEDVRSAFGHAVDIQVLLICEFGNMFESIDRELSSGVAQPTGRRVHCTRELPFRSASSDFGLATMRCNNDFKLLQTATIASCCK